MTEGEEIVTLEEEILGHVMLSSSLYSWPP